MSSQDAHPTPQVRAEAIRAAIEARLAAPVTVAEIAAAVGLSPFYCARFFTVMTGESPIAYVRRRRLEIAARRIAADADDKLIEIAFDACFESQEAFTRAFKRQFGLSPGAFRRVHQAYRPPGDTPMVLTPASAAAVTLREGLVHRPAFRVAGISRMFTMETRSGIPTLWDECLPRFPLAGQIGPEAYGVVWSSTPDMHFRYIAAARIADNAPAPAGLEISTFPPRIISISASASRPIHCILSSTPPCRKSGACACRRSA
jgi:AraC family transcriptional regulator